MIRVGFRLIGGAAWQGGRNYLWNLFAAVTARPDRQIQPVLLVRPDEDPGDLRIPGVEVFETSQTFDAPRSGRWDALSSSRSGETPSRDTGARGRRSR